MIDAFLKLMEDDSKDIDIKSLFRNKKEQISWEKMVNIFEAIQIDNVSEGLQTIQEKYKLTRQEELSILAYVKFLEMMVAKVNLAKDIIMKDKSDDESTTKAKSYSGSMYG
jgi:dsDNA-binding SOS-regulon protein